MRSAGTRRDAEGEVGYIILGHAASEAGIEVWLSVAPPVSGMIGSTAGRTVFRGVPVGLRDRTLSRVAAVRQIANRDVDWVQVVVTAPAPLSDGPEGKQQSSQGNCPFTAR